MKKIEKLAEVLSEVYRSPNPNDIYTYSPGICVLPNGRLVATMDTGGPGSSPIRGKIFISDDKGITWKHVADRGFCHARPFVAGNSIYVLGQNKDLVIVRSDDMGETWSEVSYLTEGERWHQAPCNVIYKDNNVYLVMECRTYVENCDCWEVFNISPVLMRACCDDDLTKRESWTFASKLCFMDAVDLDKCNYFGMPFFKVAYAKRNPIAENCKRTFSPPGWLETNVVQFKDPNHFWYDPEGKTFHLWARAHTGWVNMAAIAKVVENDDGTMTTMLEKAPSGEPIVYVPCPGGQMKFHIVWDEETKLYWLLSSQTTDSMTRPERLPKDRYDLPNNERNRLVLHFSKNCVDWCFAGVVDIGETNFHSRHYASMAIDGEDLVVLSRSGDENAKDAHNTNVITFHRVKDFRSLVY